MPYRILCSQGFNQLFHEQQSKKMTPLYSTFAPRRIHISYTLLLSDAIAGVHGAA